MTNYTHDTVFKVLDGTKSMHGGIAEWTPGEWMPEITDIEPCARGYHLCVGPKHLREWFGPDIWTAEYAGERIDHAGDKFVVSEARILQHVDAWNERTARLFAADCAEDVLYLFENERPNDQRPRQAIETARRYANGDATQEELRAAWAAAGDAARDAAWAAAWAAAWDAAWAAAWAAAGDAAWAAARAAARAAAWAAAGAAAGDAAGDAAWAAAWEWQAERLLHYLNGGE